MRTRWLIALCFGLAFCMTAQAQRAATATGAGVVGCGDYLEIRRTDNEATTAQYSQWVSGYLFGYNFFSIHPQATTSGDNPPNKATILAYLDKYCRENPLGTVAQGANALIGELGGWRPKK